jgi:hypothetical protein
MKTRGFEFDLVPIKDSYHRRAVQISNKIAESLSKLGLTSDDIDVKEQKIPLLPGEANATWFIMGHKCHYSHSQQTRFIDNLQVVAKVIEMEVELVVSGRKEATQFIFDYEEKDELSDDRKKARTILEVPDDCKDFELIDSQYKKLSKQAHPDLGGDVEKFKEINWAHKTLKRELH